MGVELKVGRARSLAESGLHRCANQSFQPAPRRVSSLRRVLLATPSRRAVTLVVAHSLFYGLTWAIHHYIDVYCASAGLAFALVVVWMIAALAVGLITVLALAGLVRRPQWTRWEDVVEEDRANRELDAAQMGAWLNEISGRSVLYFLLISVASLFASNQMSGGFLGRFQHPGFSVMMMRSDNPSDRRRGLMSLTQRLDFETTPEIEAVVISALDDPDEGVAARAIFAAGHLRTAAAAPKVRELALGNPALTFTALISLGQIGPEGAREQGRTLVDAPKALAEPRALALMIGMLRLPAIERLRAIWSAHDDEDTRIAVVWALGEIREPKLLDFMVAALEEPSLGLRCAAAAALEGMAVFEASPALRRAFEAVKDPTLYCPEITVPVQEGGAKRVIVAYRLYQWVLIRALSTTDDPELLKWLVDHQDGVATPTHRLMRRVWENLRKKDKEGRLNSLRQRIRYRNAREALNESGGAGGSDTHHER